MIVIMRFLNIWLTDLTTFKAADLGEISETSFITFYFIQVAAAVIIHFSWIIHTAIKNIQY